MESCKGGSCGGRERGRGCWSSCAAWVKLPARAWGSGCRGLRRFRRAMVRAARGSWSILVLESLAILAVLATCPWVGTLSCHSFNSPPRSCWQWAGAGAAGGRGGQALGGLRQRTRCSGLHPPRAEAAPVSRLPHAPPRALFLEKQFWVK